MRNRKILLLLTLALLWSLTAARAQEALTPKRLASEVADLTAAGAALEADDLAAAAEKLSVPLISADDKAEWKTAIKERMSALEGLSKNPGLQASVPSPRSLSQRKNVGIRDLSRLTREIAISPERTVRADITQDRLTQYEAGLTQLLARRQAADVKLGDFNSRIEQARTDLPGFESRLAARRKTRDEAEPDASDFIGIFRRRTVARAITQHEQWISYAKQLIERSDAILEVLELESRILTTQEEREQSFVTRARKVFQQSHRAAARTLRQQAAAVRKQADAKDLDPERERELLRDAAILTLKAEVHDDVEFLQQIKEVRGLEIAENEDLKETRAWIEERFGRAGGASTRTSSLLVKALNRIRASRRNLNRELTPRLEGWLEQYLSAQAEVDDQLRELRRSSGEDRLKEALKARNNQIDEILPMLRELYGIYGEREREIDEIYPYILSLIYWVHSDQPLGAWAFGDLRIELPRAASLLFGPETRTAARSAADQGGTSFFLAAAGMLLLFALGIILPGVLRRRSLEWNYRGGTLTVLLQRLLATVLIAALAPICLLLAAQILLSMRLPIAWEVPGRMLLTGLAVIFFIRRILWSLTREGGVLESDLKISADAARQLLRASRWTVRGLLFLVLPWWILKSDSIGLQVIPRLLFTVMLGYFAIALIRLVRGKSPLVIALSGPSGFWARAWFITGPVLILGFGAIVMMDVLGYRFGARLLAINVLQTFGAAVVIAIFYKLLLNLAERATRRLRYRRDEDTNYTEARKLSEKVFEQVTRFAGAVAVIVAAVFLAGAWGIGDSVHSFFAGVKLYTIDAEAEVFVTLWDIVKAIVLIVSGHIVVANLEALYEVLVFSRMEKTDKGTRFAIVTITRYLVFLLAYSMAILTLHISFSSLGYVFAALSVGLGFGLQEIVSNFVSGLILFFERPVRVGDFVTVGDTLGVVEKISIRATEVLNLDRQVIIIPNRLFITQEVTNWSHNDDFIRRTIEVGVAYGSDVEQVKDILYDVAVKNARVRKNPPVEILMMEFGDSSLNFLVRVFTTIQDRNTVIHEINSEITRRFEEEGIEIPFPQQDLHVRSIQDARAIEALTRQRPSAPESE